MTTSGPMSYDAGGAIIPHTKKNCRMCEGNCEYLGSNTHRTSKNKPRCHSCQHPTGKCVCGEPNKYGVMK